MADNSRLIDAIDAAMALLDKAIEQKEEARKGLVKGQNGKQKGAKASK